MISWNFTLLTLIIPSLALSQQQIQPGRLASGEKPSETKGMSVREKWRYDARHLF